MKKNLPNLSASFLLLFVAVSLLSSAAFSQEASDDFPNSLSIEQIIAKLEEKNLLMRNDGEITIAGQVRFPGIIKSGKKITLLTAIAIAGGFKGDADSRIRLIRRDLKFGYIIEFFFDRKDILTGKKEDLKLDNGDIIIVPKGKRNFPVQPIKMPNEKFPLRFPRDFPLPAKVPNKNG